MEVKFISLINSKSKKYNNYYKYKKFIQFDNLRI